MNNEQYDYPEISQPIIKHFNKVHNLLCQKNHHYHSWHRHPHHKKVHTGILTVYIAILASIIFNSLFIFVPEKKVLAASNTWTMSSGTDYTYDSEKIEFSDGIAQLKQTYTPGIDWIATDGGGNNWAFRKPITITNPTTELTNYQVLLTLDTISDRIQDDCDDLRFTSSDGITSLNYWIETGTCNTATTKIWIKVPTIVANPTDTTIYLYYGNTNATGTSNGDNTFEFFDGFDGPNIDTEKWSVGANNASITDGILTINVGAITLANPLSINIQDGYMVESKVLFSGVLTNYGGTIPEISSNPYTSGGNGNSSATILYMRETGSRNVNYWAGNGSATGYNLGFATSWASLEGQWYDTGISVVGGNTASTAKLWKNNTAQTTLSNINWGKNIKYISLGYFAGGAAVDAQNTSYDWLRLRKYTSSEPSTSQGVESYLLSNTSPTLTNITSQGYSSVSAFSETLGAGSSGSIKYQISPDGGVNWYWWNSLAWTQTTAGVDETNTASEINTHLADESFNSIGSNPKYFVWRAYLISDGSQQPKLDSLDLTYIWDTAAPDTVDSVDTSPVLSGDWYRYNNTEFSWGPVDDNFNVGESESGTAGYYIYFGTSNSADPYTDRGIATNTGEGKHYITNDENNTFTLGTDTSALSSGSTYYLRIRSVDNAGNRSAISDPIVSYPYDGTEPTSPLYVSVSPSGYTRTNAFTFSWPTSGPNGPADSGGSNLAGYQYKINSGAWSETSNEGSVNLSDIASIGVNIFYLRSVDGAGNTDTSPTQANFYFNNTAPAVVSNLIVTPVSSDTNSFAFSWNAPAGEISGYYYSIETLPSISSSFTTETSLATGAYATKQGENSFYVIAKDMAGNVGFDTCSDPLVYLNGSPQGDPSGHSCAKIIFSANTAAPGIPTGLQIFDISNRDTQEYAISLKWTEPTNKGAGFDGYVIYRSDDNITFSSVGTTSGTTYADTGLESIQYYYYVKAKDNAGQYSVASSTVDITPTGRYTQPPVLTENPTSNPKAFSVEISWETDREGSSFIYLGKTEPELSSSKGIGQPEKSKKHTVEAKGLDPSSIYYYQAMWEDTDGNQGRSPTYSFTTKERPRVTNVKTFNIGLTYATISFETTSASSIDILYGKSDAYGKSVGGTSGSQTTLHSYTLNELDDSSTYHFQIKGDDIDGNELISDDYTFNTLERPRIESLRFESVEDAPTTTVKLTWLTNVETTTIVNFNSSTQGTEQRSNANYTKEHTLEISGLIDRTTYIFIAEGVDRYGNSVKSNPNTFTTPDDTRPPKISNLTIEVKSSGIVGSQKSQIIVAWDTDEPSTSMVEYDQGLSGSSYALKSQQDGTYTTSHIIILNELESSKIYHLRAVSSDKAGNTGFSADTSAITGKAQKSVIDLILNSLLNSFSWLGRVFR